MPEERPPVLGTQQRGPHPNVRTDPPARREWVAMCDRVVALEREHARLREALDYISELSDEDAWIAPRRAREALGEDGGGDG